MFCTRCLRATALRRPLPIIRQFSTTIPFRSAEPVLSTPIAEAGESKDAPISRSSCPAGTKLTGLNYLKNGQDPVALKDEEYPEWLWSCLDVIKSNKDSADDGAGDEFCRLPVPPSALTTISC